MNLRSHHFGRHTYEEIRELAQAGAVVIVPTGCTEQQGPHLPVDTDTWLVETAALAAADQAGIELGIPVLVLPACPFGPTPEHRHFGSGYIDLPQQIHEVVIAAALTSLAEQGFRRLLVWPGCGQHRLAEITEQFNKGQYNMHPETACRAALFKPPYHAIWCHVADPEVPGGHADSFVTSIALYLRPEAVRVDRIIAPPLPQEVDWHEPGLDLSQHSPTGVIGDPTRASAELGRQLWVEVVRSAVQAIRQLHQEP
jgi:creatinine amidohydrolase